MVAASSSLYVITWLTRSIIIIVGQQHERRLTRYARQGIPPVSDEMRIANCCSITSSSICITLIYLLILVCFYALLLSQFLSFLIRLLHSDGTRSQRSSPWKRWRWTDAKWKCFQSFPLIRRRCRISPTHTWWWFAVATNLERLSDIGYWSRSRKTSRSSCTATWSVSCRGISCARVARRHAWK